MTLLKLAILDKDGTLVRPKSSSRFVQHPEDQELMPGVEDAIARQLADGWTLAIASNQDDVAAGFKTLEDAIAEMRFCLSLLMSAVGSNSVLNEMAAYFCPDAGETCYEVRGESRWSEGYYPTRIHTRYGPFGMWSEGYHPPRIYTGYSPFGKWSEGYYPPKIQTRYGPFRKPCPGMLFLAIAANRPMFADYGKESGSFLWHHKNVLMVGDRPEDEVAAQAAEVSFKWASDWREGR